MHRIHVNLQREKAGGREGGRRRGETLDRFCFIWQSAKASHRSWESVLPWSLLNTHGYLASKNKKGLFHSFMKIEAKWVFWLELLTKLYDEEISPCLAQFDSLKVCLKDSPEVKSRFKLSEWFSFHPAPRTLTAKVPPSTAQHSHQRLAYSCRGYFEHKLRHFTSWTAIHDLSWRTLERPSSYIIRL